MAISEKGVVEATLLAIDQINAGGGLLGHRVMPVIRDGASDERRFAAEAESLILEESVCAIFGCWTSASRKTIKPIIEKHHMLLFYPVQYEGLETSPWIIYTGAAPNQQLLPAVKWALDHLGNRFFLVGSDYVFPHAAHAIMKDQILSLRGEVVGESYLLLGSRDVDGVVQQIEDLQPDVILNTINGDTNVAFFQALRARHITPSDTPTISFSIAEAELSAMGAGQLQGDFAAWSYFQSLDTPANRAFLQGIHQRDEAIDVVTDPMESAYVAVHLWAEAVRRAGRSEPMFVRDAVRGISMEAPQGAVCLDPHSQHLWQMVRIGRVRDDGQFDVVWETSKPVRPIPFPAYRSPQEWERFLAELFDGWNGNWANRGFRGREGQPR